LLSDTAAIYPAVWFACRCAWNDNRMRKSTRT